jgi:Xaa-Pro aminopeptidase
VITQLFALTTAEQNIFAKRRKKLMASLPDGLAIIASGDLKIRSHDTEYPFRVSSNYFYLTGHSAAGCVLLLDTRNQTECLLVPQRNKEMELWTGEMIGKERVNAFLGISESINLEDWDKTITDRLKNAKHVMFDFHASEGNTTIDQINTFLKKLSNMRKADFKSPSAMVHLPPFIEKMRLIKSTEEIEWLQKSNHIAQVGHKLAMRSARTGMHEYQLQAQVEWAFKFQGSVSHAYEVIVAGGDHANTLHYIANRHLLKNGELVLIDAGCEWMHMASDITRTFPVNGRFSAHQRDVYNAALKAQHDVLGLAKSGMTLSQCHKKACHSLTQSLIDLQILKGNLNSLIEQEAWKPFYPHGTSHWLGLDVHDQCPYKDEHMQDITLAPGMCFTVEPGLYFSSANEKISQEWRGIGVRIEDDVVVTENGLLNLSQNLPSTIAEIEQECQKDPIELMKNILKD